MAGTIIGEGNPYGQVPLWVSTHPNLTDRAKVAYAVAAGLMNYRSNELAKPRQRIADALGWHPDKVDRARAELVAAGALRVVPQFGDSGIQIPSLWVLNQNPHGAEDAGEITRPSAARKPRQIGGRGSKSAPPTSAPVRTYEGCTSAEGEGCTSADPSVIKTVNRQNIKTTTRATTPKNAEPPSDATLADQGRPGVQLALVPNLAIEATPAPKPTAYPPEFEAWYLHYPRKAAKGAALKAYETARRKASQDDLIIGAKRYSIVCERKNTPRDKIAHPATWLNRECWLDEYELGDVLTPAEAKKADQLKAMAEMAERIAARQSAQQKVISQ